MTPLHYRALAAFIAVVLVAAYMAMNRRYKELFADDAAVNETKSEQATPNKQNNKATVAPAPRNCSPTKPTNAIEYPVKCGDMTFYCDSASSAYSATLSNDQCKMEL